MHRVGDIVNTGDSDRWLVSPGVRSTYIGGSAVLLDVEEGSATAWMELLHTYG
jgi:hypothetical protein